MKFFETHAHLEYPDFEKDLPTIISSAAMLGVDRIVTIGTTVKNTLQGIAISEKHPHVYATVGIHPHYTVGFDNTMLNQYVEYLTHPNIVAAGEIGLDYFRMRNSKEEQKHMFRALLEKSVQADLPIILHCRDAWEDMKEIITPFLPYEKKMVMHCYSLDEAAANFLVENKLMLSFTGTITFPKTDNLREIIKHIPISNIMLETDCPYLAPQPVRGQRNEPKYIPMIAQCLADIKSVDLETIANATYENSSCFFGILN